MPSSHYTQATAHIKHGLFDATIVPKITLVISANTGKSGNWKKRTHIGDVDKGGPLLGGPIWRGGGPLHLGAFLLQQHNTGGQNQLKNHVHWSSGTKTFYLHSRFHANSWCKGCLVCSISMYEGERELFFYLVLSGCCRELRYLAPCAHGGLLSPRYWHDCANILGKWILWWFYCVLLDKRTKTKPQSPLKLVWVSRKFDEFVLKTHRDKRYTPFRLLSVLMWTDNAFNLS